LGLAGCGQQQSSPIATVDIARITSNWPKFINYNNQLSADTQAIQASTDSQRQKDARIAALRQRYLSMQDEVTGDVKSAVEQVANNRHFTLVVTHEFVGYGGVDITPDVEKVLKITEQPTPKV
jgi:Skp family chaperone for outer membrane proteins